MKNQHAHNGQDAEPVEVGKTSIDRLHDNDFAQTYTRESVGGNMFDVWTEFGGEWKHIEEESESLSVNRHPE